MSVRLAMLLGVIFTAVCIVLLYLFILPKKEDGKLPHFFKNSTISSKTPRFLPL